MAIEGFWRVRANPSGFHSQNLGYWDCTQDFGFRLKVVGSGIEGWGSRTVAELAVANEEKVVL